MADCASNRGGKERSLHGEAGRRGLIPVEDSAAGAESEVKEEEEDEEVEPRVDVSHMKPFTCQ